MYIINMIKELISALINPLKTILNLNLLGIKIPERRNSLWQQ